MMRIQKVIGHNFIGSTKYDFFSSHSFLFLFLFFYMFCRYQIFFHLFFYSILKSVITTLRNFKILPQLKFHYQKFQEICSKI